MPPYEHHDHTNKPRHHRARRLHLSGHCRKAWMKQTREARPMAGRRSVPGGVRVLRILLRTGGFTHRCPQATGQRDGLRHRSPNRQGHWRFQDAARPHPARLPAAGARRLQLGGRLTRLGHILGHTRVGHIASRQRCLRRRCARLQGTRLDSGSSQCIPRCPTPNPVADTPGTSEPLPALDLPCCQ